MLLFHVQREAHSFQPQMKLEAVDKRSPGLIRVATVEEVDTHRIKVFSPLPSSSCLLSEDTDGHVLVSLPGPL